MTQFFPGGSPSAYPITQPYKAAIVESIMQGDSAIWTDVEFVDVNGTEYSSPAYTLKYVLAGPSSPVVLTAAPQGGGWVTTLDSTTSAGLVPGLYAWACQLFASGVRVTIAEGEITVEADLALASAGFDKRTVAEKALEAAELALSTFQASGGRIESYTIGNRHMTFQRDSEILQVVNYWRVRVNAERTKAAGASSRRIGVRFDRAR